MIIFVRVWPDAQGNWNAKNKVIYNNAINGYNTDVVNVKYNYIYYTIYTILYWKSN